jgi:hypothetical protein
MARRCSVPTGFRMLIKSCLLLSRLVTCQDDDGCEEYTSRSECIAGTQDDEPCVWCTSAAVRTAFTAAGGGALNLIT